MSFDNRMLNRHVLIIRRTLACLFRNRTICIIIHRTKLSNFFSSIVIITFLFLQLYHIYSSGHYSPSHRLLFFIVIDANNYPNGIKRLLIHLLR
jgi:hypothetical protein